MLVRRFDAIIVAVMPGIFFFHFLFGFSVVLFVAIQRQKTRFLFANKRHKRCYNIIAAMKRLQGAEAH
jgi:hypothetical protein